MIDEWHSEEDILDVWDVNEDLKIHLMFGFSCDIALTCASPPQEEAPGAVRALWDGRVWDCPGSSSLPTGLFLDNTFLQKLIQKQLQNNSEHNKAESMHIKYTKTVLFQVPQHKITWIHNI